MKRFWLGLLLIGILVVTWEGAFGELIARLPPENVLYETDSLYHHIRVSEVAGKRYLSFNRARGHQSAVNLKDPYDLEFAYTQASFTALGFLEKGPEKVLYLGLGGGSMPRVLAKHLPEAKIDIAEIDPEVVMAAKKYFLFKVTPNMRVFEQDGRQYLRRSQEQYDLIFLDAYNDLAIPFHLTTKEFFELVKQRLKPGGIVAANVWGPPVDEFYLSELKTYQAVFTHVYRIDSITTNNYIFAADMNERVMTAEELLRRAQALQDHFSFSFSLPKYARTFEDLTKEEVTADVLSDDFAPVEVLRSRKASSN